MSAKHSPRYRLPPPPLPEAWESDPPEWKPVLAGSALQLPDPPQSVEDMRERWVSYVRVMEWGGGAGPSRPQCVWPFPVSSEGDWQSEGRRSAIRVEPREVTLAEQVQDWLTAVMNPARRFRPDPCRARGVYLMATHLTTEQAARRAGLALGVRQMQKLQRSFLEMLLAEAKKNRACGNMAVRG